MLLNGAEIAQHKSAASCWIVIHDKVYDVTSFLDQHPGGRSILLKQAGADATPEFDKIHSTEVLEDLPPTSYLGDLDPTTTASLIIPTTTGTTTTTTTTTSISDASSPIPLSLCVRATDFPSQARKRLSRRAWIYITSSANSGASLASNLASWSTLTFRPRVLRPVGAVTAHTALLSHPTPLPFFVPPMGTMGMSHPDAEFAMVRGCARKGVHAVISTASSRTLEAIFDDHRKAVAGTNSPSTLFFQLYIPEDRQRAITLLRKVRDAGYAGLFVTVDTAVLGKRSEDRRNQALEALEDGAADQAEAYSTTRQPAGTENHENAFAPAVGARPVPGQISPMISWADLEWIRAEWPGVKLVLKGIQTAEDAKLALEHGVQGVYLSNHGGRQQHTAPSALETLLEIRTYCPEVLGKVEVYLDGGCRDGADVLKALALGATAVGVGRPFLFAMAAYGTPGVEKLMDILSEEVHLGMALLGVKSLKELRPEMVNASAMLNKMWRPETRSVISRL